VLLLKLLLKLCRRGEGGELCGVSGIIALVGLAAEPAAACRIAGILECVRKTHAGRRARLLQGHFASLSC
jgi:hypothetical protein